MNDDYSRRRLIVFRSTGVSMLLLAVISVWLLFPLIDWMNDIPNSPKAWEKWKTTFRLSVLLMFVVILLASVFTSFSKISSLRLSGRITLIVMFLHVFLIVTPILGLLLFLIEYLLVIPAALYGASGVRILVDLWKWDVAEVERKCLAISICSFCFVMSDYCYIFERKYLALAWAVAID